MHGSSDVAAAPLPQFTSPEADLVLVTSDGQEFRVFSRFLIETSGVFRDLLDLPTSPNSSERVMTVSETACTLNLLLQYIYPMAHPTLTRSAIFKPFCWRPINMTPTILGASPIKAYAVACRLGLQEEALKAAKETFSLDFAEKDLDGDRDIRLGTHDAFTLFRFQRSRVDAVINVLLATPKPINCEGCSTRHFYGRPAWQASYIERCAMVLQRTSLIQADRMGLFDLEVVLNVAKFTTCGCEKCIASVTGDSQLVDRWLKTLLIKMKEAEDRISLAITPAPLEIDTAPTSTRQSPEFALRVLAAISIGKLAQWKLGLSNFHGAFN
ncbi:The BTB (BR-C, ttk and bab)/POZ (Pox virus and Zinc finger) domain [Rhizoctonia solani]|uniref:The BTB (BR-C, ttk and bab)/POZ (Pox virus and Zinc finger) domain n=1 Tax=Rhizoctonia solani TaxID=456999 RepID=A0A8H8T425_9AGAM|nr:The BTB (BR-C, ttk and bab)/POZ (Pox virus and Zinc finger) domain [Rhizoctonia solani]QRW27103.1 The BTB (BR-C, ttk and bab)/POZ (Pox virus and Zinc finger) domain [Rhizoctonia solani]